MARVSETARSLTRSQPSPRAFATAATLVRSIARRCRIQRLHRRVVLARGSAKSGMRCWKILVAHSVLSQVKRGTRTCSLVGWPTIGRSVTFRSMWSRSLPSVPQSAHTGSSVTGEQNRCVNSSATAASVIVTPSSTAGADGVGKQAGGSVQSGSWVVLGAGVGTAILTPPGPLHLVPHRITAASPLRTPDPEEPANCAGKTFVDGYIVSREGGRVNL